ncbi:MAG TPA: hypothetical protein VFL16_08705 [Steroidobacteraceae bacterium]|nr:hypothetical protein [Steroidobacteraceae bacterium]
MLRFVRVGRGLTALAVMALAGCGGGGGGGGDDPGPGTPTYSVAGTTTGLTGSVVLRLNGAGDTTVSGASFTFASRLTAGSNYTVTIQAQPVGQTCTLANATGTMPAGNVTNVAVTCANNNYSLGGNVTGLDGSVVLRLNGANDLTINGNGAYTFGTQLAHGTAYTVTVQSQPAEQVCSVANSTGNVNGADVTNLNVTCANESYLVGGTVTALAGTLVLQLNGANDLTVSAAGAFQFPTPLAGGSTYAVTVLTQPLGQTCTVTNGSGTGTADVTNVAVSCANNAATYTVGGTLSGLSGGEITLMLNNNLATLTLTANGAFAFNARVPSGLVYSVAVATQPAGQNCYVNAAGGTVGTANVTNVAVICTAVASTFQLGGNVTNLDGELWLWLNGGNTLVVNTNGAFQFDSRLPAGTAYTVIVVRQPDHQVCLIGNNTGTMPAADLANINIDCNDLSIGGTVSNLNSLGLTLTLNNEAELNVPVGATQFTFPADSTIRNGTIYTVHIKSQPASQTCTILHSSGLALTRPVVTNVEVNCLDNVTDPLAGTYVITTLDGDPLQFGAVMTFYPDGTYLFGLRSDDSDCGPGNGNGIEYGVYRWNATTHALQFRSVDIDTNGECGIYDGSQALSGSLVKNANGTLSADLLDNNGSGDHVLVTFSPAASTAGSIVGSWGDNQSFMLFRPDNRFFHVTSKSLDNVATTSPGIEHGCYSLTGTASQGSYQTNLAASCDAGVGVPVDTTGPVGYSPIPFPLAFQIDGDTFNGSSGPITPIYGPTPRIKVQ